MSVHQRHYAKKTSSQESSPVELPSGIPTEAGYWSRFFNPSDVYLRRHRASATPAQTSASARLTERERRRFAEMVVSAAGVQDEESSQSAPGTGAYSSTPTSPGPRDATPMEQIRTSKTTTETKKMHAKTKMKKTESKKTESKSSTSNKTGQE